MSIPGAGLLSLIRGRSETVSPATSTIATAEDKRFAARSDAVRALEHAVAAGSSQPQSKPIARGRCIPPLEAYAFDLDAPLPEERQINLEVTPITMLNSDYEEKHHCQIAVNDKFMCYGLKQGHVRVLCRNAADRELCKGHTSPLTDMRFLPGETALLATGSREGNLIVWKLAYQDGGIEASQLMHVKLCEASTKATFGEMRIAWKAGQTDGSTSHELAVGVGSYVVLVDVDTQQFQGLEVQLPQEVSAGFRVLSGWTGEAVVAISYSLDGALLAAGDDKGAVKVWRAASFEGGDGQEAATIQISQQPGEAVGGVAWLPTQEGYILVVGNRNNSAVELWFSQEDDSGLNFVQAQRISFESSSSGKVFYNHMQVVPEAQLMVLADTPNKAIYTLHYSGEGARCRIDYVARFGVGVPVLNFTACWNPCSGEDGGEEAEPAVELFCVQTTAVQLYKLNPELCRAAATMPGAAESANQASSLPQPSSQLATAGTAAHASTTSELESTASAPPQQMETAANAMPATAQPLRSAHNAHSAGTTSTPAEATGAEGSVESTPGTSSSASGEGSTRARGGEDAASPLQGEASILDRVSVVPSASGSQHGGVAVAASFPSELEASSGMATPEEPSSPPSTPLSGHPVTIPLPVPVSLPPASSAPEPTCVPQPSMDSGVSSPVDRVPRLMTPDDMRVVHQGSSRHSSEQDMAEARAPTPSSTHPQPSLRILQRPSAAETPVPAAAVVQPPLDLAALEGAIGEQLGGAHKKFVGHISLMYRELLKAMRSEMNSQVQQVQQAVSQRVDAALAASAQQVQEERAAVLAEQHRNIERLLVAVSSSLNQDLPSRLQEVVRAELTSLGPSMSASVAPAVQEAVKAALPQEVSGAVKAQLEAQLTTALQASLARPLQEAFRGAFQKQLLPAFEGACQSMFAQVNNALGKGFHEHMQAAKAAVEAPRALASQLEASLASVSALTLELQKERSMLSRATSIGASSAHHDVRAELTQQLQAGKYEEAFSTVLGMQDLGMVVWLCGQVDPRTVLLPEPTPLSQMVLLSLVQQLASDLSVPGKPLSTKLTWIGEAALFINPRDPTTAPHLKPVLDHVYSSLQTCLGRVHGESASACRLAMHVVHSQLAS